MTAISHHPNDQNLLIHYLRVVQDSADEQTVRMMYERLMAKYPRDPALPVHYVVWLDEHGYYEEAELLHQDLIAKEPPSYKAHYGYGAFLLKLKRFDEAAMQFRAVLNIHRGHQMAHDGLAWALWKLEDYEQAEREFRSAIYWAGMQGQPQRKFYTDLGWFYLDRERWYDALNAFESARDEAPDYYGNYWGIGRALKELGDYAAAADALRTALEKEPNLEPPASEEIPEVLHQCLEHLNSGRRDAEN